MDYKPSKYDHAIELLLSEYPNGDVRKKGRHLDGHNYPEKRKSRGQKKKLSVDVDLLHGTISHQKKKRKSVILKILTSTKFAMRNGLIPTTKFKL